MKGSFRAEGGALIRRRKRERGYILLTVMLAAALLVVAASGVALSIAFEIKRDREEELIHRGVQYARAVRRYAKQTGGFPGQLDQLRDHGGQRYLRRLYKDPITGRDFRPVYTADIARAAAGSGFNSSAGGSNETGSEDSTQQSATSDDLNPEDERHVPGEIMFGVVSSSKARTIREFNHKNRYNQWLFFYDANHDRGMEIKGPTSLSPATAPPQPRLNGQQAIQTQTTQPTQPQAPQQ